MASQSNAPATSASTNPPAAKPRTDRRKRRTAAALCRPSCRRISRRHDHSLFISSSRSGGLRVCRLADHRCCQLVAARRWRGGLPSLLSPAVGPLSLLVLSPPGLRPHCRIVQDSLMPLRIALRKRISGEGLLVCSSSGRVVTRLWHLRSIVTGIAGISQRRYEALFWRGNRASGASEFGYARPVRAETNTRFAGPARQVRCGQRRCPTSRSHLLTTMSWGMAAAPISYSTASTASICSSRWSLAPSTTWGSRSASRPQQRSLERVNQFVRQRSDETHGVRDHQRLRVRHVELAPSCPALQTAGRRRTSLPQSGD